MNEMIRSGSVETTNQKPSVFEKSSKWFASVDGVHSIEIPSYLGKNISLALRVQEKVEEALMGGHRPGFLRTIKMLNCRKTAFGVMHKIGLRELTQGRKRLSQEADREAIDVASGLDALRDDVQRLLDENHAPILGTAENMHMEEYLAGHMGEMPLIVHVFNTPQKQFGGILPKLINSSATLNATDIINLNRDHTFLVLGKDETGRYVCFQKRGPTEYQPFEVTYLDQVISSAVSPSANRIYISVIGPAE